MTNCQGVTNKRKICGKILKESNVDFCDGHLYQKNFGMDVINGILDGTNKLYKCGGNNRCKHWHCEKGNNCKACKELLAKHNKKKITYQICKGLYNHGGQCKQKSINNTLYCKDHEYMINYTDDMLNKMRKCGTCHKYRYWISELKTCDKCVEIAKKNRLKQKINDERKMCLTKGCEYHENLELGNGYCGKCNDVQIKKQQILDKGFKVCGRWHHNSKCLEKLNINDPNDSCIECRNQGNNQSNKKIANFKSKANELNTENTKILNVVEKQRKDTYFKNKIENKVNTINKINNKFTNNQFTNNQINSDDNVSVSSNSSDYFFEKESDDKIDETKYFRICTNKNCGKKFDLTHFCGPNSEITAECNFCREKNKARTVDRVRKIYNVDPEKQKANLERKKQFRIDNKLYMSIRDKYYRLKNMEKIGQEEYNKKKAEEAKKYREEHQEQVKFNNLIRRSNPENRLKYYKQRANNKNIPWSIIDQMAYVLFNSDCHYCGEKDTIENNTLGCDSKYSLNGIDRQNNAKGYDYDNIISCCQMCNFMKCEIDYDNYIKMVRHITEHVLGPSEDKLYECPELFKNRCSATYDYYLGRANKKNLEFLLTQNQFNILICFDCYMCGKETNENHINGIDRIDNTKGYTLDNCLACCGTCNYIKNKFDFCNLIEKCYVTTMRRHKSEDILSEIQENKKTVLENAQKYVNYQLEITVGELNKLNELCGSNEFNNNVSVDNQNDNEDEKLVKIKKNNNILVISKKNDENKQITKVESIKKNEINSINSIMEKNSNSNETIVIINKNEIMNDIAKKNKIEKYGIDDYKKLEALRKAKRRALNLGNSEKVKEVEDQIKSIKDSQNISSKINEYDKVDFPDKKLNINSILENNEKNQKQKYQIENQTNKKLFIFLKHLRNKNNNEKIELLKKEATDKNIEWIIEDSLALKYLENNCWYCNENENIIISRNFNHKPYDFSNCVSCCETCEVVKNNLSYGQFLNTAKHILSTMSIYPKNEKYFELFQSYYNETFDNCKLKAGKNEINFELQENQFEIIQKMCCCMCGKKQTGNTKNNVDIIDNSLGYKLNNCLPICHVCMELKSEYNLIDVVRKLCKFLFLHMDINFSEVFKNNKELKKIIGEYIENKKKEIMREINIQNNKANISAKINEPHTISGCENKTVDIIMSKEPEEIDKKSSVKYDENGYRRLMALEKQHTKAKKENNTELIKKIKDEMEGIKSGKIKPEKKQNLTTEEKRENERLRKAKYRAGLNNNKK